MSSSNAEGAETAEGNVFTFQEFNPFPLLV